MGQIISTCCQKFRRKRKLSETESFVNPDEPLAINSENSNNSDIIINVENTAFSNEPYTAESISSTENKGRADDLNYTTVKLVSEYVTPRPPLQQYRQNNELFRDKNCEIHKKIKIDNFLDYHIMTDLLTREFIIKSKVRF